MKPEFKTRLQEVYAHILNGACGDKWRRGYSVPPGTHLSINSTSCGNVDRLFDVETYDIGFSGNPNPRIPEIEAFIKAVPVKINESTKDSFVPAYGVECKSVTVPAFRLYIASMNYYSDIFHEITHWARDIAGALDAATNSQLVAFEEVIAQLGSEMLLAKFGLSNEVSTANYVSGYLKKTGGDRRETFNRACNRAAEAVEFIETVAGLSSITTKELEEAA